MPPSVVPMIHVPDVRATADWYHSIGFKVLRYNEEEGVMNWALLSFGDGEVMLNEGGKSSTDHRREMDLFVTTTDVDALYQRIKSKVELVEDLHETFYGMREFIIRDINRFWVTFGQPIQA
jgi:uncharacterized glyoxalase superfamily protein PhnB